MESSVLVDFYKAMADGSRLEIVGHLARRRCSVGELSELLGVSEPTVSHHLRRLKSVGLVAVEADGTTRRYSLDQERLNEMSKAILSSRSIDSVESRADEFDGSVMRAFVEGDRLLAIPAKRTKRDVILRWLAERFEPGRQIHEREVNELIGRSHEDTAWLRREMIGAGLLERQDGIYWRPE